MDSYMSSSVGLKDDTHSPNCCRPMIKTVFKFVECREGVSLDNLSTSAEQLIDVELSPFQHLARLSSSGVSEVLAPGVQPASDGDDETHDKL